MIHFDNTESVILDHLQQYPQASSSLGENQCPAAHSFESEALITELANSTSEVKITIVDLGVGL